MSNLEAQLGAASGTAMALRHNHSQQLKSTISWQNYLKETSHMRLNDANHKNPTIRRMHTGYVTPNDTNKHIHNMFTNNTKAPLKRSYSSDISSHGSYYGVSSGSSSSSRSR